VPADEPSPGCGRPRAWPGVCTGRARTACSLARCGPGPGRPGTGPRGRGPPCARRRRGHRRGGRHAVSPLRQEGARREVPARRLGQGTPRHRPRQLLCDRRDRGGRALPGPPGLPAGPVPPAHPQDQRLQDRAGPRPGRPARRRAGRAHRPRGGDACTAGRPGAICPPTSPSPPAWPPTRFCTGPSRRAPASADTPPGTGRAGDWAAPPRSRPLRPGDAPG